MTQSIYDDITDFTTVIPKEQFTDLPEDLYIKADSIKSNPDGLIFKACDYKLYKAFNDLENKQAREIALKSLPEFYVFQDLNLDQLDHYNAFATANGLDLVHQAEEQNQNDDIDDLLNRLRAKSSKQAETPKPKIEGFVLHNCKLSVTVNGEEHQPSIDWTISFKIKLLAYDQINIEIIKKDTKNEQD